MHFYLPTLYFALLINSAVGQTWTKLSEKGPSILEREKWDAGEHKDVKINGIAVKVSAHGPLVAISPTNNFLLYNTTTKLWDVHPSGISMQSLSSTPDGAIWGIGTGKTVYSIGGGQWGTGKNLEHISGRDAMHAVAVTDKGELVDYHDQPGPELTTDIAWTTVPNSKGLVAVEGGLSQEGNVYARDKAGKIFLLKDGKTWHELPGKLVAKSFDVFTTAGNRIAAVNDKNELFVFNGQGWTKKKAPKDGCIHVSITALEVYCATAQQDIVKATA